MANHRDQRDYEKEDEEQNEEGKKDVQTNPFCFRSAASKGELVGGLIIIPAQRWKQVQSSFRLPGESRAALPLPVR